jgi:protoporphyrinogen oxidase
MNKSQSGDVIIIGAGLAGLTAAKILKAAGKKIKILEASDGIGGRVRTDQQDGFLLDRGFQVLLTAYPETKQLLNYKALDLRPFKPGALILKENGTTVIGDPLRDPSALFKTIFSSAGNLFDKLLMMKLKLSLQKKEIADIFSKEEISTDVYLRTFGFSRAMIENFLRPFLSGIFLENNLTTSSRMFEFVFKMFSEGDTAVPAKGMGMISQQLAGGLAENELLLNTRIMHLEGKEAISQAGERFAASAFVLATDPGNLPHPYNIRHPGKHSVTSIYFKSAKVRRKPLICLNASAERIVSNIAFMDSVSSFYAPPDQSLISVSLVGDWSHHEDRYLCAMVLDELSSWYPDCSGWQHLKTYHIPYALPNDDHVRDENFGRSIKLNPYCYQCGDYLLNGSINAAMKSGRMAAELLLADQN